MGLVLCALWTALGHVEADEPSDDPQAVILSEMAEIGGFQWAPDGRQIAYLSNESGTSQIHLLSLVDGVSRQLTRHRSPVWDPQWSPDGTRLLFLSDPGWQERNEVWEVRLRDGATSRVLPNGGAVVRNARWSSDASAILLETNAGGQFDLAIWRRTDPVLRPFFKESAVRSEAQWSPDGKSLAYLSAGAVWIAGANGEKARRVIAPGLGAGLRGLRWSPDGQSLLFITDLHGDWDVGLYSVASDEWSLITSGPFEDFDASWSSDGRRVAFVSTQQFDKRLGLFDVASRKVDYISPEGSVASSPLWSPVNQVLGFLSSTPREPRQLWQFANGTRRQLTRLPERHATARLAMPEPHGYQNREGLPVQALLYKPADFRPGTRYPAIVVIHGGFDGQWVNDFDAIGQFLLHKGYVLFYPNPRGSGGYGRTYELLNDGDWGGGDTDDLLRGHDYLAGLPFVDRTRITRIRALDLEGDIAGMVYQPKDATRIPTGPDGRKVGIFILHGGSGDYRAREDMGRLLAGKLGFKVVIMNYPGRLNMNDPSHRWPGDTINPDGTVRLPIWHRDRPITHDQYTVVTNRDEDIQRRYGTVFLACAKDKTEFDDRMAAWPVAFEDGGKDLMRRHLPDGEYSIYIHGHSTGGPFSFMFSQRVANIVGVVGIENTPFGYLHGEMMTKKLKISPTWDIAFNCLRIRTWRDTTRHLGAESLDKHGPEALLQLGRLMDHVFATWDKAKSHAQFKAESTIHFNGLGPLIDGARAAARRLNLSTEDTERLVGRFVGYTRELAGRGIKPVPPPLLLISKTSPDHRMEYYKDIYLPMFAAMKPAPKVHVVQLDLGTHFYSDPEGGLPRGVGAAVAKVWHEAIMGGYYSKDTKQSK